MALQPPRLHGQRREVGIIGNDDKHVDVFGIRLGRDD
jgi:hypothetical protein